MKALTVALLLFLAACSTEPAPDPASLTVKIAGRPYECVTTALTELGSELRCRTVDL